MASARALRRFRFRFTWPPSLDEVHFATQHERAGLAVTSAGSGERAGDAVLLRARPGGRDLVAVVPVEAGESESGEAVEPPGGASRAPDRHDDLVADLGCHLVLRATARRVALRLDLEGAVLVANGDQP